jgi:hypothetical protein
VSKRKAKPAPDPTKIRLEFHVAVKDSSSDAPIWSKHEVELPRLAAVELAKLMFEFVPDEDEQPVMFAIDDSFFQQLADSERVRIECTPDDPRINERLAEDDEDREESGDWGVPV